MKRVFSIKEAKARYRRKKCRIEFFLNDPVANSCGSSQECDMSLSRQKNINDNTIIL
jgi:hypothetical protein